MNYALSYSEVRKKLKSAFDKVCQEHVYLLVERRNGDNVVLISQEDFRGLEETAYLLRSPKNAQRLLESLNRSDSSAFQIFANTDQLKDALGIE